MNCDKCVDGLFLLFTSTIKCPHCNGTGRKKPITTIYDNFHYYYKMYNGTVEYIISYEKLLRISVPEIGKDDIPQDLRLIANTTFDNAVEINIFSRNNENCSNSQFIYEDNDNNQFFKLHIGQYFNYYNIFHFYKNLQRIFPKIILEIGGSYNDSTENEYYFTPKINKKCPKCKGKGINELFDTAKSCTICNQTGYFDSIANLYQNFQKIWNTYNRASLKSNNQGHSVILKDSSCLLLQSDRINMFKINAPPYEFDSEYCLRKIANGFLSPYTRISLMHFEKINKFCSKHFLLKIYTDEFFEATKLYTWFRENIFYGELALAIVPPN